MFHEIYEVSVDEIFACNEIVDCDVLCTTWEIDGDFKEVMKIQSNPGLQKVDNRSIDLNFNMEVEIKNYLKAKQGQMPTYDETSGIRWIDPLTSQELQFYTEQGKLYRDDCVKSNNEMTNKVAEATALLSQATEIGKMIENKFWFGTITEYNKLLTINPETIYVITV